MRPGGVFDVLAQALADSENKAAASSRVLIPPEIRAVGAKEQK